jgi:ABC-2 type transport system ATP-binding protein
MIELENVTKDYNGFRAVDNLNLLVGPGEIFGFIGPNGAGKTTTIKMITGILLPSSGRVAIGGIEMKENPIAAKGIMGYIPDRPFIYEKLTGREFLAFCAGLREVPSPRAQRRIEELLEEFSLNGWGEELIESYSLGMKQRLTIAAAILHDPQVLVVDEPMVGLDPGGIRMVKELFCRLRDRGVTVFLSTHQLEVAEDLCDRLGVILGGRLIAQGRTEDLQAQAGGGKGDLEEVFLSLTKRPEP